MKNEELIQEISALEPAAEFHGDGQFLNCTIEVGNLFNLAEQLRSDTKFQFDFLFCLSGVDWKTHLMVVYHLRSTNLGHTLVLKARINDLENPEVESVCKLWPTAEFHERECYDLFGIGFRNHPDLRRILLPDEWNGFPLRKDYSDPVHIVEL